MRRKIPKRGGTTLLPSVSTLHLRERVLFVFVSCKERPPQPHPKQVSVKYKHCPPGLRFPSAVLFAHSNTRTEEGAKWLFPLGPAWKLSMMRLRDCRSPGVSLERSLERRIASLGIDSCLYNSRRPFDRSPPSLVVDDAHSHTVNHQVPAYKTSACHSLDLTCQIESSSCCS